MKESSPSPGQIPGSIGGSTPLPIPGLRSNPLALADQIEPLVRIRAVAKHYKTARGLLQLFDGLDLDIRQGELLAIVGQSGSGKSTFLHMLGALDTPSAGTIYCASTQVTKLSTREAARFRNQQVGYVWQFHYLLPEFTAQENVAMPLLARGVAKRDAMLKAARWLDETGLADRATHRPGELSGGEQQRVALARALVTEPILLLADEPTGDLDDSTAELVFRLIERLHTAHGLTSVLVTHNLELAGRCTRTLRLERGRFVEAPLNEGFPTNVKHTSALI